jgi:hypothetical protein
MRRLAGEWKMSYVPLDVFNLAGRISRCFPIAGAAELRVVDLIYGLREGRRRYVFTAEYTVDLAGAHRRECRAMSVCEPPDASGPCASLDAAPEHLPLIEQYNSLREQELRAGAGVLTESR